MKAIGWGAAAVLAALIAFIAFRSQQPDASVPEISTEALTADSESEKTSDTLHSGALAPIAHPLEESRPLEQPALSEIATQRKISLTLQGAVRDITQSLGTENITGFEIKFTQGKSVHKVLLADRKDYAVEGLVPGHVNIAIKARGYRPFSEDHELPSNPLVQKLTFYLEPIASLWIHVITPDGKDLMDAIRAEGSFTSPPSIAVVATDRPLESEIRLVPEHSSSDFAEGSVLVWFRPRTMQDGRAYSSMVEPPDPLPRELSACRGGVVLQSRLVPRDAHEIAFVISLEALHASAGSLCLRVVDANTRSPLDARADLAGIDPRYPGALRPMKTGRVPLDDDLPRVGSEACFRDREPQSYLLRVTAPGYETVREYVRIEAGKTLDLGLLPLSPPTTIEGELAERNVVPWTIQVVARPLDGERVETDSANYTCRCDSEGHFKLERLGRRKYVVRASVPMDAVIVDASAGDVQGVKLHTTKAVKLTVHADAQEFEHLLLSIYDSNGLLAGQTRWVTGDTSFFLAPGRYSIEARNGDVSLPKRSIELVSNDVEWTVGR
jgi:hypothetical protein